MESGEDRGPSSLTFEAMGELDMGMRKRLVGFRELFQSDDGRGDRGRRPGVVVYELATNAVYRTLILDPMCCDEIRVTYASYSESSKILCGSRSTEMSKPASSSFLAVVGVSAARRSNSFFSQRSQRGCPDIIFVWTGR